MDLKHEELRFDASDSKRSLCALLATLQQQQQARESVHDLDQVMVYLHGFPDMAVHPTRLEFASRLPSKLASAFLAQENDNEDDANGKRTRAFLAFNFSGTPGSDTAQQSGFFHKKLSKEVVDALTVCEYAASVLLAGSETNDKKLHVVGLSTGAIIASLLRRALVQSDVIAASHPRISITVIAGLADLQQGIRGDFDDQQWQDFDSRDQCLKEFYLPRDCPLPHNAVIYRANDWTSALRTEEEAHEFLACQNNGKIFLPLSRAYVDECLQGKLDIAAAVGGGTTNDRTIPFLVVHGEQDQSVPFESGQQLYALATEPKTFLGISKANHLLSNSKHLKLALRAILKHCASL